MKIENSLSPQQKAILKVAAAYHDVGHTNGSNGHEERSAKIVEQELQSHNASEEFIRKTKNAILATKMDPSGLFHPNISKGEQIGKVLADADVHNFGLPWEQFYNRTKEVQKETGVSSETEWFKSTISLLESHEWHSNGAKYYPNKQANIKQMKQHF